MNQEIIPSPNFRPWGPFVPEGYQLLRVTRQDIALASTAFAVAGIFAISAAYIAVGQTRRSPQPWRSAYIWMIWLEWSASVVIALECLLYLLRVIRPSFYFYMSILFCWTIQIQLLLQIIINRIRIILPNRRHGLHIMCGTAIITSLLCISVYIIWIPARLQISQRWIHINTYWDRAEKVIYLFMDAALNINFIRVVKDNLVRNGLNKYKRLVRFNERIIVVSILMDIMIIAAMDIPNSFVYAIFHPPAYLIKLNIEMSMAHLITTIALGNQKCPLRFHDQALGRHSANSSVTAKPPSRKETFFGGLFKRHNDQTQHRQNVITKRQDFVIQSSLMTDPENVHMGFYQEESPFGSSRMCHEVYDSGPRSITKTRCTHHQEAPAYSAKSKELEASWTSDAVTWPETTWPPKWSDIHLNGPG